MLSTGIAAGDIVYKGHLEYIPEQNEQSMLVMICPNWRSTKKKKDQIFRKSPLFCKRVNSLKYAPYGSNNIIQQCYNISTHRVTSLTAFTLLNIFVR